MNTKIYLKGVRAYGYVGLLPEENVLGQWFEVDATLWVDFEPATHSDRIEDTYDYRQSISIIENLIKTAKFALVERLAGAIADRLLEDSRVEQVQVRVIKRPPIPEFQGSITVEVVRKSAGLVNNQSSETADTKIKKTAAKRIEKISEQSTEKDAQISLEGIISLEEIIEEIPERAEKKTKSPGIKSTEIRASDSQLNSKSNQKKIIDIYTDGACSGNPGAGGWGTLIKFNDGTVKELSGSSKQTTNNQMEMQAAIAALEYLSEHPQSESITLYTDSKYLIDGVSKWVKNWKRNNWKTSSKEAVKNQAQWQILDRLNEEAKVQWRWVAGHSGNPGNERCDEIARQQIHLNQNSR
jgi:ribonuclease HI